MVRATLLFVLSTFTCSQTLARTIISEVEPHGGIRQSANGSNMQHADIMREATRSLLDHMDVRGGGLSLDDSYYDYYLYEDSLGASGRKCNCDTKAKGSIRVFNSNIQQSSGNKNFVGSQYIPECVDVVTFTEIDNDGLLNEIMKTAGGDWKGATCSVHKNDCNAAWDWATGVGIAWNTARFKSVSLSELNLSTKIANNAYGIRVSEETEKGKSWGPQYRKIALAHVQPIAGGAGFILGAVHLGNDGDGCGQGGRAGMAVQEAMTKANVSAAVVCGDWNELSGKCRTENFLKKAGGGVRCADCCGCDGPIQCVAVGGTFKDNCNENKNDAVANDQLIAGHQITFKISGK